MARSIAALILFLCIQGQAYSTTYYPLSFTGKLDDACHVAVVKIDNAVGWRPEGVRAKYEYSARVVEAWRLTSKRVEFGFNGSLRVGSEALLIVDDCMEDEEFWKLEYGRISEVFEIEKSLGFLEAEYWVRLPIGTYRLPDSWQIADYSEEYTLGSKTPSTYGNKFVNLKDIERYLGEPFYRNDWLYRDY